MFSGFCGVEQLLISMALFTLRISLTTGRYKYQLLYCHRLCTVFLELYVGVLDQTLTEQSSLLAGISSNIEKPLEKYKAKQLHKHYDFKGYTFHTLIAWVRLLRTFSSKQSQKKTLKLLNSELTGKQIMCCGG